MQTPEQIIKASRILGLNPNELSVESTKQAWKRLVLKTPPTEAGGDAGLLYNNAKDTIVQWLEFKTIGNYL